MKEEQVHRGADHRCGAAGGDRSRDERRRQRARREGPDAVQLEVEVRRDDGSAYHDKYVFQTLMGGTIGRRSLLPAAIPSPCGLSEEAPHHGTNIGGGQNDRRLPLKQL